jgi:hypothetical protein
MSDEEVIEMVMALVEMSEENFQECIEYVANIDALDEAKTFMNEMIRVAAEKRKRLSVT